MTLQIQALNRAKREQRLVIQEKAMADGSLSYVEQDFIDLANGTDLDTLTAMAVAAAAGDLSGLIARMTELKAEVKAEVKAEQEAKAKQLAEAQARVR